MDGLSESNEFNCWWCEVVFEFGVVLLGDRNDIGFFFVYLKL